MVLSKEEAETLYHHIVFPPKTPNRPDNDDEHDLAIRYLAEVFKSFVINAPPSVKSACLNLNNDISSWGKLYNGHIINEDQALIALDALHTHGKYRLPLCVIAD